MDAFLELLKQYNWKKESEGQATFKREQIAKFLGIRPSTFSEWATSKRLPTKIPLISYVAHTRLDGDQGEWARRATRAQEAYDRIPKNQRSGAELEALIALDAQDGVQPVEDVSQSSDSGSAEEPTDSAARPHERAGIRLSRFGRAIRSQLHDSMRWRLAFLALFATCLTLVVAASIYVFGNDAPNNSAAVENSHLSAAGGKFAQCAYVIKQPADVFDSPDEGSSVLRDKPTGSGITILDSPHPQGWTPVLTPRETPREHWMLTTALSTPTAGPDPCPDHD
jgi:hypothetical protein